MAVDSRCLIIQVRSSDTTSSSTVKVGITCLDMMSHCSVAMGQTADGGWGTLKKHSFLLLYMGDAWTGRLKPIVSMSYDLWSRNGSTKWKKKTHFREWANDFPKRSHSLICCLLKIVWNLIFGGWITMIDRDDNSLCCRHLLHVTAVFHWLVLMHLQWAR